MGSATVFGRMLSVAVTVALCLTPPHAHAQEVRGEIVDNTRRPVADVGVVLLDEQRQMVASSSSDAQGAFSVVAPEDGYYYVYMTRLGYRSLFDGPFELDSGIPLELFAVIHAMPLTLEGVDVTVDAADAEVPRLAAVGFYERRAAGFGHFIEREKILRLAGAHITDVLRSIPLLRVIRHTGGTGGASGLLNPEVRMRGGLRGLCVPTLYVDGIVAAQGGLSARTPIRPDDFVSPEVVEAIEVYTGLAQMPLQYLPRAGCGVMLVWTRHTRLRR